MIKQDLSTWSDAQLVAQFQLDQSPHAFEQIYLRYFSKINNTCLGILRDSELAFDLAQDIVIKIHEALPTLEHGFLLGYWIHCVTKNESLNCRRTLSKLTIVELEDCLLAEPDYFEQLELILEKEHRLTSLEFILQNMPHDEQELILLKYFQNWKVDQLADKLHLSKSAVKMRLARARRRIAGAVAKIEAAT